MTRKTFRMTILLAISVGLYGLVWAGDTKDGKAKSKPKESRAELAWVEYGDALARAKAEDKHVLIDFYTSWCGWCKVMDRKTYANEGIINRLNDNFLAVKINAESAKKFQVGDTELSGRMLAREFGVASFPMTWFLKPDGTRLVAVPGYRGPDDFLKILTLIDTRAYEEHLQSKNDKPGL